MTAVQIKESIMKIILSRKGFDSSTGKITSPIFDNGDMLSYPIPENISKGVIREEFSMLQYNGLDLAELLNQFGYGEEKNQICHIDPDLVEKRRKNEVNNWKAIFGQCGPAASYLNNTVKVKVGDIFLFFGNFHHVTKQEDGTYNKVKRTGDFYRDNDLQVIWGYLQVGKIVTNREEQGEYGWHPHSKTHYTHEVSNNTMYIASKTLSFNSNMDGYGILKFRKDRVLTKEKYTKANWIKHQVYDTNSIIGNRTNKSKDENLSIYYQGQWQELGLKETKECEEWAKKLLNNNLQ